jgi:hypothetical protein
MMRRRKRGEEELTPPDRNRPNRLKKAAVALGRYTYIVLPTLTGPIVLGCRQREVFWPIKGP